MADLNGIALPDDVLWTDELIYTPNSHTKKFTAGGNLQVIKHRRKKGRKITLDCGVGVPEIGVKAPTLLMIKQFQALRDADEAMTVTVASGETFNVMFDHENGHIEATPVINYAVAEDGDFYYLILHLFEV